MADALVESEGRGWQRSLTTKQACSLESYLDRAFELRVQEVTRGSAPAIPNIKPAQRQRIEAAHAFSSIARIVAKTLHAS